MPVPNSIDDLSTTEAENSPQGTETAKGTIDNYFRRHASFIAQLRDRIAGLASSTIAFIQSGTGAVARTVQAELRDRVSVLQFGADPSGVADSTAAIQAALNTGKAVFLPVGVYKLTAPIKVAVVGQRVVGESMQETYLTTAAGSTHDILRIAASLVEVTGIMFRPGSVSNICIRVYGGWCYLHDNRFLAAVPQSGTAVVLTDQDPEAGFVAGAYTHRIEGNHFGASGYTFARDIDDYSANGITATRFHGNQHLCDYPMRLVTGGGNSYTGNLYQSFTGTPEAKVGTAIDLGANVYGEVIDGNNYFELYAIALVSRAATNDYQAFKATQNHYDNVATTYSATSVNFYHDDGVSRSEIKNGWVDAYGGAAERLFKGPSGNVLLTLDDVGGAVGTRKRYGATATLSYTADAQTKTPESEYAFITGAGAARANCVLGNAGVHDGQPLTLIAQSWAVTLLNTNVRFASGAASVQFGGTAGMVQAMQLVYSSAYAAWIEAGRTIY